MNKSRNILTFIGVALLAISLPLAIYILKTGTFDFRISAFESNEPVHALITDVTATSFKVSWITERQVYGGVQLTNSVEPVSESNTTSYHSLTVSNLSPNSTYTFNLLSSGQLFAQTYSLTTASVAGASSNIWLYGQVFATDGTTAQNGGLISITLSQGDTTSQTLSTTINETGGYTLNLGSILNSKLDAAFIESTITTATLKIYIDTNSDAISKTYTFDLTKSTQVPNIYLGDINIDIMPGLSGN